MNKDYTYCAQSQHCPRKKQCKRHIEKHPNCVLWWVDPNHKTEEDYLKCGYFQIKNR